MQETGTIIITGAGGNIGKATVQQLLSKGYHISGIIDKKKELPSSSRQIQYYQADLTEESATTHLIQEIADTHNGIQATIMIVGGFAMGGIEDTDMQAIHNMFQLNFQTAYQVARPSFKYMKQSGKGGKLIFIGAKPALEIQEGTGVIAYAISKSMLFTLSDLMNASGKAHGIVSSVIVPSIVDTPPNRNAMPDADVKDWVTPDSIAEVISFLLSEQSKDLRSPIMKLYGNV